MSLEASVYTPDPTPIRRDDLIRAAADAGWVLRAVHDIFEPACFRTVSGGVLTDGDYFYGWRAGDRHAGDYEQALAAQRVEQLESWAQEDSVRVREINTVLSHLRAVRATPAMRSWCIAMNFASSRPIPQALWGRRPGSSRRGEQLLLLLGPRSSFLTRPGGARLHDKARGIIAREVTHSDLKATTISGVANDHKDARHLRNQEQGHRRQLHRTIDQPGWQVGRAFSPFGQRAAS
jgi:hypothetical protein